MINKSIPTELKWASQNSKNFVSLSEISDHHLHNIVYHVNKLSNYYNRRFIRLLHEYATARGIEVENAKLKPLPPTKDNSFTPWDYSAGMEGYPK
jgi:hypothetical protein